jgi:hypothetical protein
MMPYPLARHTVKDFELWKRPLTGPRSARARGHERLRAPRPGEPNEVIVLLERDDTDRMKGFMMSFELHQAMLGAGVAVRPEVFILALSERPTGWTDSA